MMSADMFIECSTIVSLSILKHALQRPCGHFPVCILAVIRAQKDMILKCKVSVVIWMSGVSHLPMSC